MPEEHGARTFISECPSCFNALMQNDHAKD